MWRLERQDKNGRSLFKSSCFSIKTIEGGREAFKHTHRSGVLSRAIHYSLRRKSQPTQKIWRCPPDSYLWSYWKQADKGSVDGIVLECILSKTICRPWSDVRNLFDRWDTSGCGRTLGPPTYSIHTFTKVKKMYNCTATRNTKQHCITHFFHKHIFVAEGDNMDNTEHTL